MKICDIIGCTSIATHQAELVIYGRSEKLHTPAVGRSGVYVCAAHATEAIARDFLPDSAG